MKKEVVFLIFVVFFLSTVSAEIIITQQPDELYNLGETLNIPLTVSTSTGIYDILQISLICNGEEYEISTENIALPGGESINIEKSVLLIKKFIGNSSGECNLKSYLQGNPSDSVVSNEFTISNSIIIEIGTEKKEFNPGESIVIQGVTSKENGEPVNGFIELSVINSNNNSENKIYTNKINNGVFSINFSMSENAEAGQYLLKLVAYEKDPTEEISNNGFLDYNILIKQIPTSLEIVFDKKEVMPDTNLRVKSVLRDQTGEKIKSSAIMTIKNQNNKIFEQKEIATDEFLEFPIKYNEIPAKWVVVSFSNKITTESIFEILENEEAEINIVNNTLIITNIGNVFYNETLLVKIGQESVNIQAELGIDESKRYSLSAPDGEYEIVVLSNGENYLTKSVTLTGSAINIKEITNFGAIITYPIAWVFVVLVFGFVIFMMFKRNHKKNFMAYIPKFKRRRKEDKVPLEAMPEEKSQKKIEIKNRAELSLSLKGEKQGASIICLKIKNHDGLSEKEQSTNNTLQNIVNLSEDNNSFVYENQECLFIILSPATTRTLKNEKKAIEIAQKIKNILEKHNKIFKQKIEFGISVNYGDLITKKENNIIKFMSFGNTILNGKRIASISDKEVLLTEEVGKRNVSGIKMEKHLENNIDYYTVKEIKEKSDEHKKFISSFLKRLEEDNKKKNEER